MSDPTTSPVVTGIAVRHRGRRLRRRRRSRSTTTIAIAAVAVLLAIGLLLVPDVLRRRSAAHRDRHLHSDP